MKKWMIGIFFALLLIPGVLGFFPAGDEGENVENRRLAEKPELTWQNLRSYPAEAEAYLNDHAPFRTQFLDAYATLNMELFDSIDSSEVIVGRDGWLFYTGGATRLDVLGIGMFSDGECEELLGLLQAVRDKYAGEGKEFVFLLLPNKETVYRQYLPEAYAPLTDTSRAKSLVRYLREHSDLTVVYPEEALLQASAQYPTYYRTDTHWNAFGAFVGVQELVAALGGEPAKTAELTVRVSEGERGDLGDFGHTPMRYLTEEEVVPAPYRSGAAVTVLADGDGLYHSRTEGAPDGRRLTMCGDSFQGAMQDILSQEYGEVALIRWNFQEKHALTDYPGDIFVYEIVERELGRMRYDLSNMLAE